MVGSTRSPGLGAWGRHAQGLKHKADLGARLKAKPKRQLKGQGFQRPAPASEGLEGPGQFQDPWVLGVVLGARGGKP